MHFFLKEKKREKEKKTDQPNKRFQLNHKKVVCRCMQRFLVFAAFAIETALNTHTHNRTSYRNS